MLEEPSYNTLPIQLTISTKDMLQGKSRIELAQYIMQAAHKIASYKLLELHDRATIHSPLSS